MAFRRVRESAAMAETSDRILAESTNHLPKTPILERGLPQAVPK